MGNPGGTRVSKMFPDYDELSADWEDPETATWTEETAAEHNAWREANHLEHRVPRAVAGELCDPNYVGHVTGTVKQRRLVCVDGPFDGMELDVPPGGSQVVINAAFGRKTDLRGPVVYTVTDTPEGLRLVFAGQPDQTEAIALEMSGRTDDTPRLIVLP